MPKKQPAVNAQGIPDLSVDTKVHPPHEGVEVSEQEATAPPWADDSK